MFFSSHPQVCCEFGSYRKTAMLTRQIGLWGLVGYPLIGLRRRLQISLGKKQENAIVASRIAQGFDEMHESSAEERKEVARKWQLLEEDIRVSY